MEIILDYIWGNIEKIASFTAVLSFIGLLLYHTIKFIRNALKKSKQKRYRIKTELKKQNIITKLETAKDTEKEKLLKEIAELNRRLADPEKALQAEQERISRIESALIRESNDIGAKKLEEARTSLEKGDFSKADELFAKIEAHEGLAIKRAAQAARVRGDIAQQDIRWADAAKHYARAVQLDPIFENLIVAQKFAFDMGDYDSALSLCLQTKEVAITEHKENSEQYALVLNNLGTLCRAQGQYEEAESYYKQAIKINEDLLKGDLPETATSMDNLGALYCEQGRQKDAERLFDKALKIYINKFGENHIDTAICINNLASLYSDQGRDKDAEIFFKRSLKIRRNVLGKNHPEVANSLHNIAMFYLKNKQFDDAESLLQDALKIRQNALNENHPAIGNTLNSIGGLYSVQERYKDADPFFKQALKIFNTTFGPDHPTTKGVKINYENNKKRLANAENGASQ